MISPQWWEWNFSIFKNRLNRDARTKLSFASDQRLKKYLGVEPGSVSPFGLINDKEKHVHLFIDEKLNESERLTFHPNVNTASLVVSKEDLLKFLAHTGNTFEFIKLYD